MRAGLGGSDSLHISGTLPAVAPSAPEGYSDVTSRINSLYSAFGTLGSSPMAMTSGPGGQPLFPTRQNPAGGFSGAAQQQIFDQNEAERREREAPKPKESASMPPPLPPNFPPNGGNGGNGGNNDDDNKDPSRYDKQALTVDAWEDKFAPALNPNDPDGSWSGTMLETYGEDLEYVQNADPHTVWTLVESDDGQHILNGYHTVNRFAYFVTEKKWTEGDTFTIKVD